MAVQGYAISQGLVNQIKQNARALRDIGARQQRRVGAPRYISYLVKITGKSALGLPLSASYEGVQVRYNTSGVPTVLSGGLVWGTSDPDSLPPILDLLSTTALAMQDTDDDMQRIPTNQIVEGFMFGDTDDATQWYTIGAGQPANTPFEVDVVTDGGTAGDGTTQCSFTYIVKTISTSPQTLLTGATPTWARPATGMFVAGTHGRAMYQADGTIILLQVDEVQDTDGPCRA